MNITPSSRPLATLACGLALALVPRAAVADTAPPEIEHTPVVQAPAGAPIEVRARITDDSGIFAPSVYVRTDDDDAYDNISMRAQGVDVYVATIPPPRDTGTLVYFLEAFDVNGNGPARVGGPGAPLVVRIYDPDDPPPGLVTAIRALEPPPAAPSSAVVLAPPADPRDDEDDSSVFETWWFWTIIGVAVAGGAAAGLVVALDDDPITAVNVEIRGPDPAAGL